MAAKKPFIRKGGKIFEYRIFQWLRGFLMFFASLLMRLWWATLRIETPDEVKRMFGDNSKPAAIIFWHNYLFVMTYWRSLRKKDNVYALISAGDIGAWISHLFRFFNLKAIRGSVNLRNKQALKELIQAVEDGADAAITPDGSRGPVYKFKQGSALLAQKTNCAIMLFSCEFSNAWRLMTWDRFYIPKPFSKIKIKGKHFRSYKELTDSDDPAEITKKLEETLRSMTSDNLIEK